MPSAAADRRVDPLNRLRSELAPHGVAPDPGLANLRIAARAAAVQPLVLAFGLLVLHNVQLTLFMVFGVFSLLVLANYGGPALDRFVAYMVTAAVGAVFVALGSLASPYPAAAALVAFAVVFCIEFAGVFSGYVGGSRFPLLLAYVLAASVPAPATAVPEQVAGWLIGGTIAAAARVLLWPLYERDALRESAMHALRSLAQLVSAARGDPTASAQRDRAVRAVAEFRTAYRQTPYRPAGPTRRDRALARLVTELEQGLSFAAPPAAAADADPKLPESDLLVAALVAVLDASAAVLKGGTAPDLRALETARKAHRAALDEWAGARLRSGASAESVLEGLDHDHWLRMLAYHCLAIGAITTIVAGHTVAAEGITIPYGTPLSAGVRPTLGRIAQTVLAHLSWTSPLLHTSVRAAIGLSLAVFVARVFGLQHAFWVVLGTMSVLRSNALGTGRTTVQALAGTLLGFVLGGVFALIFSRDPIVLWASLPVAVFLAAYAPTGVSFVAGQAAFTVLLLILFNLLTPVGWTVGLVRIEDVAVGAAIGVGAGTLLWPRGARSDFASNLARLYRLVAVHIAESINLVLGTGHEAAVKATRDDVWDAREKVGESFDLLLGESGSRRLPADVAGSMVSAADHAVAVADSFQVLVDLGYVARACAEAVGTLDSGAAALVASWFMLAERIDGIAVVRTVPLHRDELREAAVDCLASWRGTDPAHGASAIAVAWAREWIEQLGAWVGELDEPAGRVAESAAAPWWR